MAIYREFIKHMLVFNNKDSK